MLNISESKLMGFVNKFANSAAGKRKISEVINRHRISGKPLASGDKVVSLADMSAAADILMSIIRAHLPTSIGSVGDSLNKTTLDELPTGEHVISVGFDERSLARESLWREGYDGVDNIVALLNNGYSASDTVYGSWKGADIKSRQSREALGFMQSAINEFNASYGSLYNVTATLSDEYG